MGRRIVRHLCGRPTVTAAIDADVTLAREFGLDSSCHLLADPQGAVTLGVTEVDALSDSRASRCSS